jgi:MarR family transcriptional regulator, organic hydroperoxide resistance regulator
MAATRSRKKKSKTKVAPQVVAAPGLGQAPAQTAAAAPTQTATPKHATDKGTTDNGLFEGFLPHLIARLAYQLNADLIEKLRLEGINIARWRILAVLAMGDGITISEIIDRAMMQQSALSRVLMTMESEEYVRRVPRRDDGRYVDVFLTEKGRALFNSLDTVVRRRQNRLLKGFSPQETEAAFALVRRLSRNLTE